MYHTRQNEQLGNATLCKSMIENSNKVWKCSNVHQWTVPTFWTRSCW